MTTKKIIVDKEIIKRWEEVDVPKSEAELDAKLEEEGFFLIPPFVVRKRKQAMQLAKQASVVNQVKQQQKEEKKNSTKTRTK